MKTKAITTIMIMLFLASIMVIAVPVQADGTTINYGDISLSGVQSGHFSHVWDLTAGDLVISFTVDLTGMVDDYGGGAHAWAELGVREVGYGDFNPTWKSEGAGVWLATDYDWTLDTFDPDPDPPGPTLDLDDKLILQKGGGWDESYYNLPSTPPNPYANHRIWFDRDGVDPWQAMSPLAVDGGTYNTGGTYDIVITLHADDATSGTAYMTVNGLSQGFETDGDWSTMELSPAGMTFTGDMEHMQVFYGLYGYGAVHSVVFEDITVTGTLAPTKIEFKGRGGTLSSIEGTPFTGVVKVMEFQGQAMVDGEDVKGEAVLVVRAIGPGGEKISLTAKMKIDSLIIYGGPWEWGFGGSGFVIVFIDGIRTKYDCPEQNSIRFGIDVDGPLGINIAGGTTSGKDDVFRVAGMSLVMFHAKS